MSLGEDRVRVKFNPSATGLVDQIKQKTAELIDLCDIEVNQKTDELIDLCGRIGVSESGDISHETARIVDIAQVRYNLARTLVDQAKTAYEEAAMWAVKAATAGK